MKKKIILSIIVCVLTFGLTGCGGSDNRNSNRPNNNGNNSNNNGSNNGSNSNNNANSAGGAGGFTHEDVIAALKNAGSISGEPTKTDVSSIDGAMEGVIYNNNVLVITWKDYSDEAIFKQVDSHFKKGTIPYDGKDHEFYGWGSTALIFLDGNKDEDGIQALRTL